MTDHYSSSHYPEDQYEPGSNGLVLLNQGTLGKSGHFPIYL